MEKKLSDLAIGDKVIISRLYDKKVGVVEKVTKKTLIVNGMRFNRELGYQMISDSWHRKYINVAKQEEIDKVEEEQWRDKVIYKITHYAFSSLSTEKLKQINQILDSK